MGVLADFTSISAVYARGDGALGEVHGPGGILLWKKFAAFNETNAARTNAPTPTGCAGVWVTLVGGGGAGGAGVINASLGRGGGGGGGGGTYIPRVFVPASLLGPTYTVSVGQGGVGQVAVVNATTVKDGGDGTASSFASGGVTLIANGGFGGPGGGIASQQPVKATSAATVSGVSCPWIRGGAGTDSSIALSPGPDGPAAPSNSTGTGGGGAGASTDSLGWNYGTGGNGGAGMAGAGGAGGPKGAARPGNRGTDGATWNGSGTVKCGSGGGGAGVALNYYQGSGGTGGYPGGGGGGSSGTSTSVYAVKSADGGNGYVLLEWV